MNDEDPVIRISVTPPVARRRPPALGRGLEALMGESRREEPLVASAGARGTAPATGEGLAVLPVAAIEPHPEQPRRHFDDAALDELAASIAARGVIQPVIVRELGPGRYQLVAGERRWRAAQRARLHEIPALVRDLTEREVMALALIENLQREDLNPIEEARAYQRLAESEGMSQADIARMVDKSRSHVANLMRLRNLPLPVHDWLTAGEITMGHARALLGAEDPLSLGRMIVQRGLSVRDTERLIKKAKAPARARSARSGDRVGDPDLLALERQLTDMLGLKVKINHQARSGTMTLSYSSLEQLDMICQRLSGEPI